MKAAIAIILNKYPELASQLKANHAFIPEPQDLKLQCIHIDDFSGISLITDDPLAHHCYCSRAFVRARNGDIVAALGPVTKGYGEYFNNYLGLGLPEYIEIPVHPKYNQNPFKSLMISEHTIAKLGNKINGDSVLLHPYMGHSDAWELARTLNSKLGVPIKVLAPLPVLTELVNNRSIFADMVALILGIPYRLTSFPVANATQIATCIVTKFKATDRIALRVVNSATGLGTYMLEPKTRAQLKPEELQTKIAVWLKEIQWNNVPYITVECWEPQVLCSPSLQLWIPPAAEGSPIIEGIFDQEFDPNNPVQFTGSTTSNLSGVILENLKKDALKIAQAFQALGYLGRCSFDLILCGTNLANANYKFVECNGRWGGTSTSMALMNRLFLNHREQAYYAKTVNVPALKGTPFDIIFKYLEPILYNHINATGWLILHNPSCVKAIGTLDAITLADTQQEAIARQKILLTQLEHFCNA